MAAIRGKDTKPEVTVRSFLHGQGIRFRLHRRDLPGKPDIVLPKYKSVIFVHGCYWHRHKNCKYAAVPATNQQFWERKFIENVERDVRNQEALKKLGWNVLVVMECELRNDRKLVSLIRDLKDGR